MKYRIEQIDHLHYEEATQIEGAVSSISDVELQKVSGSEYSLHSLKRSLERGEVALLTSTPVCPVFEKNSGTIEKRADHSIALPSEAIQRFEQRFTHKEKKGGTTPSSDNLPPPPPMPHYQPEPVVNAVPKKDLYEYNFEVACSDASFRATVGCNFELGKTKTDTVYGSWQQKPTEHGTMYTALPSMDEPKRLTAKVASPSKGISIADVSVKELGSGIVHEAYIPVMPAVQVGERLGFPTHGYYYHFNNCRLVQEYKIMGDGKSAFFGTPSSHEQLSDEQGFNTLQSAVLVHWKIKGQEIHNQHLLYLEKKITPEELADINQSWLDEHGVQLDISKLLETTSNAALPSKQNFPAQEPATYNTPMNSHYSYSERLISGSNQVQPINSMGKIRTDITIINLKPERILRIGVFFDGTGQNRENDIYKEKRGSKSRTNIARLFDAYPVQPGESAKVYVSGVGTVDGAWQTPHVIDAGDDETTLAQAFGVDMGPPLAAKTGAFYKWQTLLRQLNEILTDISTEYPKTTHVAFDVFGFSRGAALARHFVNAALAGLPDYTKSKQWANDVSIYPNLLGSLAGERFDLKDGFEVDRKRNTSVRFVGLFDTVGSFYWPGDDDEGSFTLKLDPTCAHKVFQICAHHEYRKNFSLTSLKSGESLPDNFYEEIFPGCHTDVGGGYPSKAQYDKHGLPERLGFPVESTYNRELAKTKPYEKHYNLAMTYRGGSAAFNTFMEQQVQKEQEAWNAECRNKYTHYGEVKREGKTLYYYRLQPVSNGIAGLTLERMKQQAEFAGIYWKENDYYLQQDYIADPVLKKICEDLKLEPVGKITPASWLDSVSQASSTNIHRSHDTVINNGYNTAKEKLINSVSRKTDGSLYREVFENA